MAASASRYVAYERVSTARQGASGLGLEAQRQAIEGFAASRGATVIGRFTEVESGSTRTGRNSSRRCTLPRSPGPRS